MQPIIHLQNQNLRVANLDKDFLKLTQLMSPKNDFIGKIYNQNKNLGVTGEPIGVTPTIISRGEELEDSFKDFTSKFYYNKNTS